MRGEGLIDGACLNSVGYQKRAAASARQAEEVSKTDTGLQPHFTDVRNLCGAFDGVPRMLQLLRAALFNCVSADQVCGIAVQSFGADMAKAD